MPKRISYIKIIGYALTTLYAVSFWIFVIFIKIPEYKTNTAISAWIYAGLFAALLIGALAVVMLKEWGRKLIVILNGLLFLFLMITYIPKQDMFSLCYFIMSLIVFLYFSQTRVKMFFHGGKIVDSWKSILIIDDDETLIKIIRPILISHGFSVLTSTTGEDGLQIARLQKPDLIILDVILPGIKGREVCKELKRDEKTKNIPVVFLTAKDSEDDIKAEIEVGGETHLTKPVHAKALISTIQNILFPNV